jgi:hypothetical protein
MKNDILASAVALSDHDLLARLDALAGNERAACVELVAHLAALDARPALYAAQGYGSLFGYCTQALRLSEDAACNRSAAARACRRFPVILELLASGALSVTSVRLLRPHLTVENHEAILARASGRTRREIDALVAQLAPQPDVVSSVRKLPTRQTTLRPPAAAEALALLGPSAAEPTVQPLAKPAAEPTATAPPPLRPAARPIIQPIAPERYRVQFTVGPETHEKLRRLQALLRREIPNGDPGAIFDRAVTLLLEKVEKAKLGAAAKPRPQPVIRPGTDSAARGKTSRYIPRRVARAVWRRDDAQCAFRTAAGLRCTERTYLELHHIHPHIMQGPATVDNIALRCRRHNQYEAEMEFGPRTAVASRQPARDRSEAPTPPAP